MNKISSALKNRRKQLNMSVDTVCEKLKRFGVNITANTIYNYETGYRSPDAETLLILCDIYEIEDILGTFGYKSESATQNSDGLETSKAIFNDLPEALQDEALRYMRYLAEREGKTD